MIKHLLFAAVAMALVSCHARTHTPMQHVVTEKYSASLRPPGTTIQDGMITTVTYPAN